MIQNYNLKIVGLFLGCWPQLNKDLKKEDIDLDVSRLTCLVISMQAC